jgi:hypothetical protein
VKLVAALVADNNLDILCLVHVSVVKCCWLPGVWSFSERSRVIEGWRRQVRRLPRYISRYIGEKRFELAPDHVHVKVKMAR